MSKEMKRLVEEIADGFKEMDINEYEPYQLEGKVKWAIIRIGNAVLSGECPELDKSLGVAGRLEQEPQTRPYAHGVEQSLKGWILNRFDDGARTFVAFRGEEDMPKELLDEITKGQRP